MMAVRVYTIKVRVVVVKQTTLRRDAERYAKKFGTCDGFRMEIFTVYKQ